MTGVQTCALPIWRLGLPTESWLGVAAAAQAGKAGPLGKRPVSPSAMLGADAGPSQPGASQSPGSQADDEPTCAVAQSPLGLAWGQEAYL